ncbi:MULTISPECIES: NrtA/SsuA/CpmA family ABC transporter substrate-binding protein [Protofrankia]|uniref:NMT1/THI5 like domain-containing protein n=1 Tax=Candidatus Protofrankia datiscae TaxID=2716812 RepID=F8B6J3_9ACTN|nr:MULTISPECIES: NrtA/SsuA/CpmA family ABC transporter substrate-binding protein [Protofrankia]AEH09295.1 NMT1/THI5 like domain-containing protein [Candidatus Protofrankia datiscae]
MSPANSLWTPTVARGAGAGTGRHVVIGRRGLSRRTFLSTVAAAGLAVPLAACGSDDSSSGGGNTSTVRLTFGTGSPEKERGELEKNLRAQGIAVQWLGPFPNHAPTMQAVTGGSADFSFGGSSTPADAAILAGSPLVYVGFGESSPRTSAILVLPKSGIRSVKDLAGKSVAVNKAGLGEFLLVAALEKYGVPKDQVKFVYLNPPDAGPAFSTGKVDAWSIWSGPREQAEVTYGAVPIFVDQDELPRQLDFRTYLVRREYAEKNPDLVRKVINAYVAEYEWQANHIEETVRIQTAAANYPDGVLQKLTANRVVTKLKLIDDDAIEKLQYGADWMTDHKVLSGKLVVADHAVKL